MAESTGTNSLRKRLRSLPFLLVLLVWAVLYLPHLRTSPAWYGDETLALTAGLDLTRGIPAHRAMWNTFWHPYAPYQPGYELLIGWAARLFQDDIYGARVVNVFLGLAIAVLICFYARPRLGVVPALFAALMFLCYEQTVIHFRWVFTHNLIALGFTLAFLTLMRPPSRRNSLIAGGGFALSAAALPLFVYGLVPAGLLRLKRPSTWVYIFGPPAAVVLISLGMGWLLHQPNQFLWNDLLATLHFYTSSTGENSRSLFQISLNLWRFFTQDTWHIFGLISLFACLSRRYYAVGVSGLIIAFLLVQNRQNLPVFYYQAVIFLPLMMIAYGVALRRVVFFLRRNGLKISFLRKAQVGFLAVPLASGLALLPQSITGNLKPRIAFWTVQSSSELEEAARWVNQHTTPESLVICHANVAWLLKARTADFQQATTWAGYSTWPFEQPLPRTQFRYEADIKAAAFAVVSDIDQRWTLLQPNVDKMVEVLQTEKWPVVWRSENIVIFANPRFANISRSENTRSQ